MYSKNHSLLYVLFCVYFLSQLDKRMMVPSISPFPVLLKRKAVRGLPPPNEELLILNYCLLGADYKRKKKAVFKGFKFFRNIFLFFHTVLLPKLICGEYCTFVFVLCLFWVL